MSLQIATNWIPVTSKSLLFWLDSVNGITNEDWLFPTEENSAVTVCLQWTTFILSVLLITGSTCGEQFLDLLFVLDPGQSKCQLAQTQALEASARNSGSHVSPVAAIFVPECHSDGDFLPVQCHNQTGYCWCSTPDGKPVSGTSVLHLIPNCTGLYGPIGTCLICHVCSGYTLVIHVSLSNCDAFI